VLVLTFCTRALRGARCPVCGSFFPGARRSGRLGLTCVAGASAADVKAAESPAAHLSPYYEADRVRRTRLRLTVRASTSAKSFCLPLARLFLSN
jgi:hypothetical protein